jgi:hypothetical protein
LSPAASDSTWREKGEINKCFIVIAKYNLGFYLTQGLVFAKTTYELLTIIVHIGLPYHKSNKG